jgi:hypothetical protein
MSSIEKKIFATFTLFVLALLFLGQPAMAKVVPDDFGDSDDRESATVLDEQCTIDYVGFRFSGDHTTVQWPNGIYYGQFGQLCFVTSCDTDTVYAYCNDLDHNLQSLPYCVEIDSAVITSDSCSDAQVRATAYIQAWCPVTDNASDDLVQLALWKLSTNTEDDSPDIGIPFFCIDGGWGYPDTSDTPAYPYVNTVFGWDDDINNEANAKVLEALDRNVALPGDNILLSNDPAVIGGGFSEVTVRVCLERGAHALSLGNSGVEGVMFIFTSSVGTMSEDTVFTDATGCAEITITQPTEEPEDALITVCTCSAWPELMIPCTQTNKQDLLAVAEVSNLCEELRIPGDTWEPVELISFTAMSSSNGVELFWTTGSETNVDHFEIQRRAAGTGEFLMLGNVTATNSGTGGNYRYSDGNGIQGRSYEYRLVDVGFGGEREVIPTVVTATFGSNVSGTITDYDLAEAYPNPFNAQTTIQYAIPTAADVRLVVYDVQGREITVLASGRHEAGTHTANFDAARLTSGVYFYSLIAPDFSMTKRLVLIK